MTEQEPTVGKLKEKETQTEQCDQNFLWVKTARCKLCLKQIQSTVSVNGTLIMTLPTNMAHILNCCYDSIVMKCNCNHNMIFPLF